MKRLSSVCFILAALSLACTGQSDPGTEVSAADDTADNPLEEAAGVGARFEALAGAMVGSFTAESPDDGNASATIEESQASSSRTRLYQISIDSSDLPYSSGDIVIPLTFDAERDMFIGMTRESCDDPGCLAIDSLFVKIWKVTSGEVRIRYTLYGTHYSDDGSEEDESVYASRRLVKQEEDFSIDFGSSSLPEDIRALVTEIIADECELPGAPWTLSDVEVEEMDGETEYLIIVEGGEGGAYLVIYRTSSGDLDIGEYSCE